MHGSGQRNGRKELCRKTLQQQTENLKRSTNVRKDWRSGYRRHSYLGGFRQMHLPSQKYWERRARIAGRPQNIATDTDARWTRTRLIHVITLY